MICPWYQLWHKLQLFTDFSRDNIVTQSHSQISTFVPVAWYKQSHTGHSFKGIPEQRGVPKKWGVGQSGHEQIHSNPTWESSGRAEPPKNFWQQENRPGKRRPGHTPFSFPSNSLSLAKVPFYHSHSQGRQRAPDCHLEELNFLVPTPCAPMSPLQEMMGIIKAIYDMMGKYTYPVLKEDTPRQHVDIFFQVRTHNLCGSFKLNLDQSTHSIWAVFCIQASTTHCKKQRRITRCTIPRE